MVVLRQAQGAIGPIDTPEGLWLYSCERLPSLLSFSAEYNSKIIVAELRRGPNAGSYVIWNVHSSIFIYKSQLNDRDPLRKIDLRPPPGTATGPMGYITSMSYIADSADEYDLLVGLSTGEIRALSLSAQLLASVTNFRPITSLTFNNGEGALCPSRCTAVLWQPGSNGGAFLSIHANGAVYMHQKIIGNSSDTRLLARTTSESSLRPAAARELRPGGGRSHGIAAAAFSPAGDCLALACYDGVLRIVDILNGSLICGFKSYYGGLLCCAWSPDGRLIAAGGEDDLVAVYNVEERIAVAHLEGHSSWVTAVAFDPWAASAVASMESGRYRLGSVGQDCQGMLWEVAVGIENGVIQGLRNGGEDMEVDRGAASSEGSSRGRSLSKRHAGGIVAALPRAEMTFIEPIAQVKMHMEPLCDIVFQQHAVLISSNDGTVKKFLRPLAANARMEEDQS